MQENLFHNTALFSNVPAEIAEEISLFTKKNIYTKNTTILDRQSPHNIFIYILRGSAKIVNETASGEGVITGILNANDHYGEQFIFGHASENIHIIKSISKVFILSISINSLKRFMDLSPQLTLNILQSTLKRQENLNLEIEHLSIQNAAQRIGCCLLRLCGRQLCASKTLLLPYDKLILASRLGMCPETFSRGLAKLKDQCNIMIDGNIIHINDIHAVSAYVCQNCSLRFPCGMSF